MGGVPESPPDRQPCIPFSAEDVDAAAYWSLRDACLRHGLLPSFRHGLLLDVAMVAPWDEVAVSALRKVTHQEVRRFCVADSDFDRAVTVLEGRGPVPARLECTEGSPSEAERPPRPDAWDFHRRSPREIAAEIVRFAFAAGASDILLDEQEAWMDVSVKLGGRKEILPPVEKGAAPGLLRAFKEIAGMATQSTPLPQSGAASLPAGGGRSADLRIEVTPCVHGESLVARVQDRRLQLERMRRLPFVHPWQTGAALACLRQSQGLIIATGPTGSGKTTTLYACLGQLDRSALNIRTLEDPVEFIVPGITQIPVGADTGRGFEPGLRSLLRQAPDVILLGEIRDRAAAQTCIDAVDTGHLILATLHTRDAVGAVARLLDLGLTGRPIASALLLAIGQRLVRRLCPDCRRPETPTRRQASHFERYLLPVPAVLHSQGGCARCGESGERGVTPIFEFFHPAACDALAELIGSADRHSFDERALRSRWVELGGSPLVREALLLAAAGEIAHSEALRFERNPPV
jgi:type II secretory ATPase GspE/PulE/Tfp pilus assembly ATPase PilB-like protein